MPRVRLLLFAAALVVVRPAWGQDESRQDIAVQNQLLELRQDLDALRAQVNAGGSSGPQPAQSAPSDSGAPAAGGDMTAQLLNRILALEDQTRTLSGKIDDLQNGLQKQNADLSKQIGDLTFRVQALEGNNPAAAGGASAGGAPDAGTASPPAGVLGEPDRQARPVVPVGGLQAGYAALARRDYPAAEASARQVLANPKSPRAYDARFLLAQSLAGQRDFQKAALAYDDTYSASRRGAHAQDALVGLANSLASLGAKPAACATLSKLRGEFTPLRPDVKASVAFVGRRAACR